MKKHSRFSIGGALSFVILSGLLFPQESYANKNKEQVIVVYTEPRTAEIVVQREGRDRVFTPMSSGRTAITVNRRDANISLRFRFGRDTPRIFLDGIPDPVNRGYYDYPETIYYDYETDKWDVVPIVKAEPVAPPQTAPVVRPGEMVSRDNPGGTELERTIIRWYFDSAPRGSRIFWRVISSVPDQVKNTNELYLTTTPYEETRSFNIIGLTYENSRDVTIEIKLTMPGYHDQVKRYNVRQAIDQQEISGFFDMVKIPAE